MIAVGDVLGSEEWGLSNCVVYHCLFLGFIPLSCFRYYYYYYHYY